MKIFYYSRSFDNWRKQQSESLGFVPTMGALHEGHIALVRKAKCTTYQCVVSIFVNPRQFNNSEDLRLYPRTLEEDLYKLQRAGADAVIIPETSDLYAGENSDLPDISPLDTVLEGHYRPGHFKGVVQVLMQLFRMVSPDDVFFGLKDLQQCMVIEKLIRSRFPQIRQHNMPTIRENSGLAMSSRNRRLSAAGLENAAEIYRQLRLLAQQGSNMGRALQTAVDALKTRGIDTEYLSLVGLPDMQNLQEHHPGARDAIVFAGYLEGVRLIDNVLLE